MTGFRSRPIFVLAVLAAAGCQGNPAPSDSDVLDAEIEIRANLAQLGPEDQRLAEQQKYCPLMEGVRLGATGRPHKVTVKGVSAFVCCEGCVQATQDDPDQALTKIRELEQVRAKELAPRNP